MRLVTPIRTGVNNFGITHCEREYSVSLAKITVSMNELWRPLGMSIIENRWLILLINLSAMLERHVIPLTLIEPRANSIMPASLCGKGGGSLYLEISARAMAELFHLGDDDERMAQSSMVELRQGGVSLNGGDHIQHTSS